MIGALIGGGLSALGSLFGGNKAKKAARRNEGMLNDFKTEGMGYIDQGHNAAQGYLEQAGGLWQPFAQYGQTMGQNATNMYSDALGLGGAEGTARAQGAFTNSPGYQFNMDQGLQALERRAASQGRLQSGQTGIDTMNFAQGLASQDYNNWLNNVSGLGNNMLGMWQTGLTGQAGSLSDLANLATGTSGQKLQLGGQVLSGLMGANNQRAEAEQQQIGGVFGGLSKMAGGAFGKYL